MPSAAMEEGNMSAYNVVRFRVKPGREGEFLDAHRTMRPQFSGFRKGALVRTGDRSYCFIGEWDDFDHLVAARDAMVAFLGSFRDTLEDLGHGLGVTDPVSGPVVVDVAG
jgi:hypothetical protein